MGIWRAHQGALEKAVNAVAHHIVENIEGLLARGWNANHLLEGGHCGDSSKPTTSWSSVAGLQRCTSCTSCATIDHQGLPRLAADS